MRVRALAWCRFVLPLLCAPSLSTACRGPERDDPSAAGEHVPTRQERRAFTLAELGLDDREQRFAATCANLAGPGHEARLYHDCQGALSADGSRYVTLLFAAIDTKLPTYDDAAFTNLANGQMLRVGYIENHGPEPYNIGGTGTNAYWVNPDKGTHCVYVGPVKPSQLGADWRPMVIPPPPSGATSGCVIDDANTILPYDPSKKFQANRIDPTNVLGDYPIAASIDWGKNPKQHIFGFSCGRGWCLVAGHANPQPPDIPGGGNHHQIRGWHDQQVVAVLDAGGVLVPNPAGAVATIMPERGLNSKPEDEFKQGAFVRVATVHFDKKVQKYLDRFGFDAGTNSVEIQYITSASEWVALVTSAGGATKRLIVDRTPDTSGGGPPKEPPGAARWGWVTRDEVGWVRCGAACCEITDDVYTGKG